MKEMLKISVLSAAIVSAVAIRDAQTSDKSVNPFGPEDEMGALTLNPELVAAVASSQPVIFR